jgi:PD-(D/E)XK nuclease superfamily protein
MISTITQLKDFLKCPQMAFYTHELRRVPIETPVNLDVGKIFHEYMHLKLQGKPLAIQDVRSWVEASDDARHQWAKHKLWLPINHVQMPPEWEIVAIEHPLMAGWSTGYLQGRLDAIIKYNGKYWSLQWKTYTGDLLDLIERVRLSWHEVGYQFLAECHNFKPWGGTILGACEKLPGYRLVPNPATGKKERFDVTDEDRIHALTFHYLARSPEVQAKMLRNLQFMVTRMEMDWVAQLRNYDQCWGSHGRSRCPYFDVCHDGALIDSAAFKDAEVRYQV